MEVANVVGHLLARVGNEALHALAQPEREDYRRRLARFPPAEDSAMELVFEFASELGVGEPGDAQAVLALVASEREDVSYVVLNLATGEAVVQTRATVLEKREVGYVGAAFAPLRSSPWIYWNPVSWPMNEPRFLPGSTLT